MIGSACSGDDRKIIECNFMKMPKSLAMMANSDAESSVIRHDHHDAVGLSVSSEFSRQRMTIPQRAAPRRAPLVKSATTKAHQGAGMGYRVRAKAAVRSRASGVGGAPGAVHTPCTRTCSDQAVIWAPRTRAAGTTPDPMPALIRVHAPLSRSSSKVANHRAGSAEQGPSDFFPS